MDCYYGKTTSQGIAIGKIVELIKKDNIVRRIHIDDSEKEMERFQIALDSAIEQLRRLYEDTVKKIGEANAAIFEVHQMMLEDDDYIESVNNIICSQMVNAEYAVAATSDNFSGIFAAMNDHYMKERAADIKDVSERVISILDNNSSNGYTITEPCILVADDLAPSETVQLDKEKVLAFVTRQGSTYSHTAILARTLNIPAIVNVSVPRNIVNKMAVVNGPAGEVIINPDNAVLTNLSSKQKELLDKRKLLLELKGKPTITKSGKEIKLYANIGGVGDIGSVLENDAAGIGLFRSEFLYLQASSYPSEEEQFNAYKTVVEMMSGKKVIIRTLDIGADKKVDYFDLDQEENPALGYRAVRICLDRVDIFKTQLRALCRASIFGNISIMIPMIASLWEVRRVKEIFHEVLSELEQNNIPYNKPEFGIMIETPAAALISDELAHEVDYFSIGSNDLTQYTLAIDRQNPGLEVFYNAHHPAIMRLIKMVVDNAHKAGIWVGICGELGADISLTQEFVEMGVDELSVTPNMILPIRKRIREIL